MQQHFTVRDFFFRDDPYSSRSGCELMMGMDDCTSPALDRACRREDRVGPAHMKRRASAVQIAPAKRHADAGVAASVQKEIAPNSLDCDTHRDSMMAELL